MAPPSPPHLHGGPQAPRGPPRPDPLLSLTGRGLKSHAYIHSVQFSHHVFLNLHTLKFYCLPDNYEIIDSSLEDITVRRGGGVAELPGGGGLGSVSPLRTPFLSRSTC